MDREDCYLQEVTKTVKRSLPEESFINIKRGGKMSKKDKLRVADGVIRNKQLKEMRKSVNKNRVRSKMNRVNLGDEIKTMMIDIL